MVEHAFGRLERFGRLPLLAEAFLFLHLPRPDIFFRGLSCRSVNRTAGKAKKEMLNFKEKQARKGRTAHADEKDKPGGQA